MVPAFLIIERESVKIQKKIKNGRRKRIPSTKMFWE
jgi:hypothetical protein